MGFAHTMGRVIVAAVFASLLIAPTPGNAGTTVKKPAKRHCKKGKAGPKAKGRSCRAKARSDETPMPGPSGIPAAPVVDAPPSAFERPIAPNARCELVVNGPCSIYTEKFWELQARYERFESSFAVYPVPPDCAEQSQPGGPPVPCPAVEAQLYPDGSLEGGGGWFVDPCAPAGWRRWSGPDDPGPCSAVP